MQADFSQYYRLGQTVTITPPTIAGYITPAPQTVHLTSIETTVPMVYAADPNANNSSNGNGSGSGNANQAGNSTKTDGDKLANTGSSLMAWIAGSLTLIATGGAVVVVRRRL